MSGFCTLSVIDLDTIDVSNLNRQFLFRSEHVGQPKAPVSAQAALKFNPDACITAYHANIKDSNFGIKFIAGFALVLNALDNLDARRYVNRLCLAANVPLIESGTTGYLGQVMPIRKGLTACYECHPKPTQKVYPICTIRSTPDKPVHCIVWAKECLKLIFGQSSESMLYEDPDSTDPSTYMPYVQLPTEKTPHNLLTYSKRLLVALYHTEVLKRISMDVYRTAKRPPSPIDPTLISATLDNMLSGAYDVPTSAPNWEQKVWTTEEALIEFALCVQQIATERAAHLGMIAFDKDDLHTMRFVAATANLRCRIFEITALSYHDAKGVAGNIIPAIASTNAIIAGLQVLEAIHMLKVISKDKISEKEINLQHRHTYCMRVPTRKGYYLMPSTADAPSASCYVCGTTQLTLLVHLFVSKSILVFHFISCLWVILCALLRLT